MTEQRSNGRSARWWIGSVYAVLLALVVPWYWPADDARHVYGMPVWALASLLAVFATSAFTAWIYMCRSEATADDDPQPRGSGSRAEH